MKKRLIGIDVIRILCAILILFFHLGGRGIEFKGWNEWIGNQVEFIMILFGNVPKWWDWVVALLFCGYIGYDWAEAQNNAKTLDNAIDSAVALYLDIINLFLRLLGSSKDDN